MNSSKTISLNILVLVFTLFEFYHCAPVLFPFVVKPGACPSIAGQTTLVKAQYLGKWYELKRFPAIFEWGLDCTTAEYGDDGDSISVTNTGYNRIDVFGSKVVLRKSVANGAATTPDVAKPAELAVSFGPQGGSSDTANYFIQSTDYTNYAVVFSCTPIFTFNIQFAWILTRQAGVEPSNLADLMQDLKDAGVDTSQFLTINQEGCPS